MTLWLAAIVEFLVAWCVASMGVGHTALDDAIHVSLVQRCFLYGGVDALLVPALLPPAASACGASAS
jgi:hypothetical protein